MGDDDRDRELLEAWCGGDKRAGELLTTKYFDALRAYFFRRAPDEYEDLTSLTFTKLAESVCNYRGEGTVRAYIYGFARNVLLHHLRALQRHPRFDPLTSSLLDAYGRRPSSLLIDQENHQIMVDALQEISLPDQDLLELRYWGGLKARELSVLFEIPEGTVSSRLHYAIQKLAAKFREVSERSREPSEEELIRWMSEVAPRAR